MDYNRRFLQLVAMVYNGLQWITMGYNTAPNYTMGYNIVKTGFYNSVKTVFTIL